MSAFLHELENQVRGQICVFPLTRPHDVRPPSPRWGEVKINERIKNATNHHLKNRPSGFD
jgi:hypothetical protein